MQWPIEVPASKTAYPRMSDSLYESWVIAIIISEYSSVSWSSTEIVCWFVILCRIDLDFPLYNIFPYTIHHATLTPLLCHFVQQHALYSAHTQVLIQHSFPITSAPLETENNLVHYQLLLFYLANTSFILYTSLLCVYIVICSYLLSSTYKNIKIYNMLTSEYHSVSTYLA